VAGIGYAPDGHVARDGRRVELAQAPDLAALVEVLARCNDAELAQEDGQWKVIGEPTEGALRTLARKLGFARGAAARLAVIPFDSQHKFMATLHQMPDGAPRILVKGAPRRSWRAAPASAPRTGAASRWTPPSGRTGSRR